MMRTIWIAMLCIGFGIGLGLGIGLSQEVVNKRELPFSPSRQARDTIYLSGEIPLKADGTFETGDTGASDASNDAESWQNAAEKWLQL